MKKARYKTKCFYCSCAIKKGECYWIIGGVKACAKCAKVEYEKQNEKKE